MILLLTTCISISEYLTRDIKVVRNDKITIEEIT